MLDGEQFEELELDFQNDSLDRKFILFMTGISSITVLIIIYCILGVVRIIM